MRDLLMLCVMFAWVPLALGDVFVAYLLWEWLSILSPQYFLFGFMSNLRYGLLFAAITFVLMLAGKKKLPGQFQATRTSNLILLFMFHATISALFSIQPNPDNFEAYSNFIKSLIFVLLMPLLVTDRFRLHAMLLMLVLGAGFHGVQEGLKVIFTGGSYYAQGIQTTMLTDNNLFAVGIIMTIPLCYYLYQYSERRLVRWALLAALLATLAAVVGSRSRGGFITIGAVAILMILNSRRKLLSLTLVAAGAGLIVLFSPESWFERINTIQSANQDSSFMGRVAAWNICTLIAMDNPIFGGGFRASAVQWLWDGLKHAPGLFDVPLDFYPEEAKVAHSNYFQVIGDLGFVGFFIYIAILLNAIATRFQIARICDRIGKSALWARDMADMLMISVVAYAVGGSGVSLPYYDVFYVIAMLLEILRQHVAKLAVVPRKQPAWETP